MSRPRILVSPRAVSGDVLIETRHRVRKPASKPQSPEHKRTLIIGEMVQNLPDTPLLRLVPMERLFLGNTAKNLSTFRDLPFHHRDDVVLGNLIDVLEIVRFRFAAF